MDRHQKAVYLTFDDGPIPEATPFILDILREQGIKATFFMVGDNVRKYPDVFRRVVEAGHRIGNHTFNHIDGLKYLSKNYLKNADKTLEEIMAKMADLGLKGDGGVLGQAKLFRPPHGWMRTLQYKVMRYKGYKIIMWDLVTRDYSTWLNADEVLANVKRYARNGSIITFHDSLRSIDKLHKILPEALEWLIAEGYEFKVFD